MDLTEAEDSKERWQEYTEKLYEKHLYDSDNHDGVTPHLELDILECKVKWALGSNITMKEVSGGDRIPVELFQILKDDAVKVLYSICQQIWKIQQWPDEWKRCFYSNHKETQCQRMFKLLHNCTHFTCWQVMFKILQTRLQVHGMLTMNFQMFKLDLEKAEEPEIKSPTSVGSLKK